MVLDKRSLWVVLATCISMCIARPSGPDISSSTNRDNVCNAMRPNPTTSPHGNGTAGDGDYRLEINPPMTEATDGFNYTADTAYTIRLVGTTAAATINGFLVQARVPGDTPTLGQTPMLLGSFQNVSGQQTYDCDGAGVADQATITHSQNQNSVSSVQFTWTSPSTAGVVDFYYTVLRALTTHYDAIRARDVGVLAVTPPPTTIAMGTTNTPVPTDILGTETTTQAQTTPPFSDLTAPQRSPDDYRLQVLSPDGCSRSSCNLFIGIDTNTGDDRYIDIYMEGTAEGWVAVGFSDTRNMFMTDVVSCNRLGERIMPIDGWNPASPTRTSITDDLQNVTLHTAFYNASITRIYCTVSKTIAPSGSQDLDLTNSLFIVFARRISPSSQLEALDSHAVDGTAVRGASANRFAIASDTGAAGQDMFDTVHRPNLIRAHGILMIIAWPLLAITAIFFALFMRPALPNGEWFLVHRAFMLASLFIGATAFVLIFVALKNSNGLVDFSSGISRAHMIIGIIVMTLQIINPIITIFRCTPGDSKRWIFNLFHGSLIGFIAEGLALVNVGFGLSIFSVTVSQSFSDQEPLWVMVTWFAFYAILVITGFIVFSVFTSKSKEKYSVPATVSYSVKEKEADLVKMTPPGYEPEEEEKKSPERKPPSKDAPLRWGFLAVYLVVTVPIMIAVIVMVALP